MTSRHDGTRTWNLSWTLENRLKQATSGSDSVTFVYDGDGNMVLRTENGQATVYLGKLYQHNHSSGVQTYQYFFNGQLTARREGSAVRFFLTDHLGGTATTLTPSGAVEAQLRYDPWGNARWASGTTPTSYRYTGQREDALLGLYDYRARYYDPSIGRFISADTIVTDPSSPQSLNRYAYVNNSPIKYTDPSGHCIFGLDTAACIAIGLGILKVVDYGWTAYDTWQAGRTLADPNASRDDKMMAGLTVGMSVLFEAIEPDDILPVGLPIDDIVRRGILKGAQEALEEGGPEALEGFLRNQLGDHADDVLKKVDELLGIDNVRFHEDPGQLQHIFRDAPGHLLEDTLENRQLLLDTVSQNNFVEIDQHGNQIFVRTLDDGREIWVQVRNGIIQNGGLNQTPIWN